jgi:hypothetical protein
MTPMERKQSISTKMIDGKKGESYRSKQLQEHSSSLRPTNFKRVFARHGRRQRKVRAATDLEYVLAYFEVDWRGADKKTKDVNFDPLSIASSSEVKLIKLSLTLVRLMLNTLRCLLNVLKFVQT